MSVQETNSDVDIVINDDVTISLYDLAMAIANRPAIVQIIADAVRAQLLMQARQMGNTMGATAQRSRPLAVLPAVPATLRIN